MLHTSVVPGSYRCIPLLCSTLALYCAAAPTFPLGCALPRHAYHSSRSSATPSFPAISSEHQSLYPRGDRPPADLCLEQPRSWIEEEAAAEIGRGGRTVVWVNGHDGVEGNERADRKANEAAWVGSRMLRPDIVTPAGIRQAFPMGRPSKQAKWNREALRGLTYIVIDRGSQRWWLHKMGRVEEDPLCRLCGEGIAQNTVSCPGVADGKGWRWKQIWEDPEWCEKLAEAVRG
ncbi:hypothetical protein EV426DRAFT_661913 [Tirmania nivea]|nr:hypothetical protein EV426DRAFT_661913 [Tirmania nivea]